MAYNNNSSLCGCFTAQIPFAAFGISHESWQKVMKHKKTNQVPGSLNDQSLSSDLSQRSFTSSDLNTSSMFSSTTGTSMIVLEY